MSAKRNTLVLDLDETLVHSSEADALRPTEQSRMGRKPDYDLGDMRGYFRPHLQSFLRWAFDNFNVGVWTAGSPEYANDIVRVVFEPLGLKPIFVLNSRNCVPRLENVSGKEYAKLQCKPLAKVWSGEVPAARDLTPSNTLAIDDRADTALENLDNLLLIPAFSVNVPRAQRDDFLVKLQRFLTSSGLTTAHDVRKVDKTGWWFAQPNRRRSPRASKYSRTSQASPRRIARTSPRHTATRRSVK
jgi:RNA polymerase II subunit A small phosphatase-like protein